MSALVSIEAALRDRNLIGAALGVTGSPTDLWSWRVWLSTLKAAYGGTMSEEDHRMFALVSGGRAPPMKRVREVVVVASRRSGKGRMGAALAVYEATMVERNLAPGEVGVVAIISPTKQQSAVMLGYCRGYFETSPVLRGEVVDITQDEIRLRNGNVIAVLTNDYRSLRGRTLLLAILDEASFLRSDESSTPDIEAARALLPGLSTTTGMLVIMSSPYRRAGLLFQRYRDFFGKEDDNTLVVSGSSMTFNPTLDNAMIESARLSDPQAALSEWEGQFRTDLAAFLSDDLIDGAIDHGRPLELPPRESVRYFAFTDASAGRHDAFTLAICHRDGGRVVADVVRGRKPPFDPASVAQEYAKLVREYRCGTIMGDNYSPGWVSGAFREAGIEYQTSPKNRSELYLETLPLWTRGAISIPNHAQLTRELRLLERRTARSGKDSVDHGPSGSDDFANAVAGAMWLASRPDEIMSFAPPIICRTPRVYVGDHPGWGLGEYGAGRGVA
jgi:hypothetical protein